MPVYPGPSAVSGGKPVRPDCTLPVCHVHSTKHDRSYRLTPSVKIVDAGNTREQNVWFEGGCDSPLESASYTKKIDQCDIEAWPNWPLSHPHWEHNFFEGSCNTAKKTDKCVIEAWSSHPHWEHKFFHLPTLFPLQQTFEGEVSTKRYCNMLASFFFKSVQLTQKERENKEIKRLVLQWAIPQPLNQQLNQKHEIDKRPLI